MAPPRDGRLHARSLCLGLRLTIGAWGWLGVVLLATAALGSYPLYSVLGFSTCPLKRS